MVVPVAAHAAKREAELQHASEIGPLNSPSPTRWSNRAEFCCGAWVRSWHTLPIRCTDQRLVWKATAVQVPAT